MRILFLSQVMHYPLDAGPKMRSYFVLRHLTQKHEVTLLTFVRDTDRPQDIAHLAEFCHAVHTMPMHRTRLRDVKFLMQSLFTQQPFLIVRDQIPAMTDKIRHVIVSEPFHSASFTVIVATLLDIDTLRFTGEAGVKLHVIWTSVLSLSDT